MSRNHQFLKNIIADSVNFIHESAQDNLNVEFTTTGNFDMLKPVRTPSVLLDEYKIIKSDSSLIIQKFESGEYRTLMSIS